MSDQAFRYASEMMQYYERCEKGKRRLSASLHRNKQIVLNRLKRILTDDESVYASKPSGERLLDIVAFHVKRFFRRALRKMLFILVLLKKQIKG